MKILKDIAYDIIDDENQRLDIYLPSVDTLKTTNILIYFHGGGLESGDKTEGLDYDYFVENEIIVISANYRMYPDAKFPEFIEDAASVVKWTLENRKQYHNVGKVFIGGSSAGAYLTSMLAFDNSYLGKYGIESADIAGYIIDSAQMTTHLHVLRERGINTKCINVDSAAPIYFLNENTVFPNALIVVAENDMPCRLEQNLLFIKTAEVFQCPEDKIVYKLMKGYAHCEYTGSKLFADMILQYMKTIK